MVKRIMAVCFIYVCVAGGWMVLAGTMFVRTEAQDQKLQASVGQLWGAAQTQPAPKIFSQVGQEAPAENFYPLAASDIKVDIDLDYRKKGLLWYSTYRVKFSGEYLVENTDAQQREVFFEFVLPAAGAGYDKFRLTVGTEQIPQVKILAQKVRQPLKLAPGESKTLQISYESQGMDEWWYNFGADVSQVKDFSLELNTNFEDIDFLRESISPTRKEQTADGWQLTWKYVNRLSGGNIGLVMPARLNPGPWAMRVTGAAPVSLFLFFFLLLVFTTIKKINVHPMNYFFIGAAFFSFHLLLAYLVDHISIHLAFWICSLVSIFLVVSYMRLVVGGRFAFVEIALSQFVYLVLFSYTFFLEGFTGLAITILCICTLFVVMQFTGKVEWDSVFAKNSKPTGPSTLVPDAPASS
ncbi:MAG: hypothetical protein AMJ79_11080 [Phycisphaerae bacterium SM23_30]|nr:MAG: hypothetical protein AMJ79_11080 [Phycisphaerae bacterium SM23_30]